MKTLVKSKIVLEDDGSSLVIYFWKRTFLFLGEWYPLGVSQNIFNKISENELNEINDNTVSKLLFDNILRKRNMKKNNKTMKIETKLNINDTAFFLMNNEVYTAKIKEIETISTERETSIIYTIYENPAGSQYTTRFYEDDVFGTKQELLNSL